VEADIVIGVPDSGFSAASDMRGVRNSIRCGIDKKPLRRTILYPTCAGRCGEEAVMLKLNPLKETILGKRVILIDDSIVRGTTSKKIVDMLRWAGAKKYIFVSVRRPRPTPAILELILRSQRAGLLRMHPWRKSGI
jgi:amidophosphoribosyltransferase